MHYTPPKKIFIPEKQPACNVGNQPDVRHLTEQKGKLFIFYTVLEERVWFLKELKKDIEGLEKSKKTVCKEIEEQESKLQDLRIGYGPFLCAPAYYSDRTIKTEEAKLIQMYNKRHDIIKNIKEKQEKFKKDIKYFIEVAVFYAGKDLNNHIDNEPNLSYLQYRKHADKAKAAILNRLIRESEHRYYLYYKNNGELGIRGVT